MKVMFKKSAVLILALILMVSMITGCGSKTSTDNKGGTAQADNKPLEIKMLSPLFENVPDMNNEWWTEFQKKTNTKWTIEWVPSGDYETKFDMVLASGDLPEIIIGLNQAKPTLISAIKKGAFWDLTPILGDFSKYPNLKSKPTPNAWNYMKVDGKIWGIPRSRPQIDLSIKIRKDWIDKLNIPMPTTLDEYRAALKKIVDSDVDGNGKKDTIGIVGSGTLGLNDGDGTFMAAFGILDIAKDADGGIIHNNVKPEYADFIEYLKGLYADGILSKEFSVMKKTQAEELFQTGRAASYARNVWRDYDFEQKIKKVQPEAVVESILPMKGPKGYTAFLAKGVYGAFYISKKVPEEKVKKIIDYFEKTSTEEYLELATFGFENIHYTLKDGQKTLTEKGTQQVATSVGQPLPMVANTWTKVFCPTAPKAYNDAKLKYVEPIGKLGKTDPFEVLVSDTWTNTWPKYEKEWQSQTVKAIVGQISMDEYRKYLDKFRNMPEFKQAFKEFADSYKGIFGN